MTIKLGLVTYNLAKDWDIPTLIERCNANGFEAVELRTTHAHGVEPSLTAAQRREVRGRFADSPVRLLSLGTTCEYHATDPNVLRQNIEETKAFCQLAADVGALGVKVRPNGFPAERSKEETLAQIGRALHECGAVARDLGVEIWLEVHGRGTQEPRHIHRIMEVADQPSVGVCWNSNPPDVINGSVRTSFHLLEPWIRSVHINELSNPAYPWVELFGLLRASGYHGYTLAEVAESPDPDRFMRYYAALWRRLVAAAV